MDKGNGLYQPKNIVGHTGDLDSSPTVYYQRKGKNNNIQFGHITQSHNIPENVGREPAYAHPKYNAKNENGQFVERIGKKSFHTSRNPFVPISDQTRESLSNVHQSFPDIKELSTMSSTDKKDTIQMRQKQLKSLESDNTIKRVGHMIQKPKKETQAFAMRLMKAYNITN